MSATGYTVLRLTELGAVPLLARHAARLGDGAAEALALWRTSAAAGVYRVMWDGKVLTPSLRPASRLVEGMPSRLAVSPFASKRGRFPKPAPPSGYDAVRADGVATLLTSADGRELYESCAATLVAWDGQGLVLAPEDAPAVASLAEAAVAANVEVRRHPLEVASDWPLLLLNAVVGTCAVAVAGRAPFPTDTRARLQALLSSEHA